MTLEDMLKLIAVKCGNRELEEMEEFAAPYFPVVQAELESDPFLPWFLKKEVSLSVVGGEVDLPADFIKIDPAVGVWFGDGNGSLSGLCVTSVKSALAKYGTQEGAPSEVTLGANKMALYPYIDSGLLTMGYFGKEPPLQANGDSNLWSEIVPWYLLSLVGLQVAEDLEHAPAVQFFGAKAESAREILFRMDVDRASSGQVLSW